MTTGWYRKKRWFAILLLVILIVLYADRGWVGRMMYPIHYAESISNYAEMYDVDPYLVASIIRVESNFSPNKVSPKGALGLMQLMPTTAEWIIKQEQADPGDLNRMHEPQVNIKYGAWYIRLLQRQFVPSDLSKESEIALIAAAYNAGPGNVEKWLKEERWDGSLGTTSNIPFGETRHYVHRVSYYYMKYMQTYPDLIQKNS